MLDGSEHYDCVIGVSGGTGSSPEASCDWRYCGGHRLENRVNAFFHGIYVEVDDAADSALKSQYRVRFDAARPW